MKTFQPLLTTFLMGIVPMFVWNATTRVVNGQGEPAITRLADVDQDFSVSGEYLGNLSETLADGKTRRMPYGLQVIALGDGRFTATLLAGGLPGNGAAKQALVTLDGGRSTSSNDVELQNAEWLVRIQQQTATVSRKEPTDQPTRVTGTLPHVTRHSPHEGLAPPPNAFVLFDGRRGNAFQDARVVDGLLQAGTDLIPLFQDFHLHAEFLVPYMPRSNAQARGNSGIYLHSRYEIQILDTFGRSGEANECGGLYKQRAPDLNMAFPPLAWQTYDITFRAARFNSQGAKCQNARITVLHNGVTIHKHVEITAKTGAGQPEGPHVLPTKLQFHGNPVQFRNLWLVNLD